MSCTPLDCGRRLCGFSAVPCEILAAPCGLGSRRLRTRDSNVLVIASGPVAIPTCLVLSPLVCGQLWKGLVGQPFTNRVGAGPSLWPKGLTSAASSHTCATTED